MFCLHPILIYSWVKAVSMVLILENHLFSSSPNCCACRCRSAYYHIEEHNVSPQSRINLYRGLLIHYFFQRQSNLQHFPCKSSQNYQTSLFKAVFAELSWFSFRYSNSVKHFTMLYDGVTYSFGIAQFDTLQELLDHFSYLPVIGTETGNIDFCYTNTH